MNLKDTGKTFLCALSSRIVVLLAVVISSIFFYSNFSFPGLFNRWDTWWYLQIAQYGYPPTLVPQYAFFPLYPAIMKAVALFILPFTDTVSALLISGLVISYVSFFVSVYFLYKLTNKIFKSNKIAFATTAFYSFWVGAVFFSYVYTEAMFMAFALGAFYYLEEGRLYRAALLGALASFTRSDGFLIFIPFLIFTLQRLLEGIKEKRYFATLTLSTIVVASPWFIWNGINYFRVSGHYFPIQTIAHDNPAHWGKYPVLPIQLTNWIYGVNWSSARFLEIFYIIIYSLILFPIAYTIGEKLFLKAKSKRQLFSIRSPTLPYWGFYFAMLYVFYDEAYFGSIPRYAVTLIPMFWVLAKVYFKNKIIGVTMLCLSSVLLMVGAFYLTGSFKYFV